MQRFNHPDRLVFLFVMTFTFLIEMGDSIFYRGTDSYMSDIHLEHFYIMEENAMSNADVLLRDDFFGPDEGETEEEHQKHAMNTTELADILSRAKDLHRDVGPDLWNYLGHPINLINLFRRLNDQWKNGLGLLLRSTPCKRWKISPMKLYMDHLRDSVPGEEDTKMVISHLLRLQGILGNPTSEVANGKLGNTQALEPLSVEDRYIIGKIKYDEEDLPTALLWFEIVADWLKQAKKDEKAELSFKESDLYGLMATGYYLEGRFDDAVSITERRLDLDPSNTRVLDNLNFFLKKQAFQPLGGHKQPRKQKKTKFERICSGQVIKPSRHRCFIEPVHGKISWYVYKKEVLRQKPPITLYHDVINKFTMEQLKEHAHTKLTNKAWISTSVFITPQMSIEIDYPKLPKKKSIRYSAQKLAFTFDQLPGRDRNLLNGWGKMQLMNVGRSGIDFSEYMHELVLQPHGYNRGIGGMFAFLSEPKEGGEIVMKRRKIFNPAPKGSILVYHSSRSTLHSLCPALGGSQWVVVQPFYENSARVCPYVKPPPPLFFVKN